MIIIAIGFGLTCVDPYTSFTTSEVEFSTPREAVKFISLDKDIEEDTIDELIVIKGDVITKYSAEEWV